MSLPYATDIQRHDMINKFFCHLYHHDRNNDNNCRTLGQNANCIWDEMSNRAFGESDVPVIIADLVERNVILGRIKEIENGNCVLTNEGRDWGHGKL